MYKNNKPARVRQIAINRKACGSFNAIVSSTPKALTDCGLAILQVLNEARSKISISATVMHCDIIHAELQRKIADPAYFKTAAELSALENMGLVAMERKKIRSKTYVKTYALTVKGLQTLEKPAFPETEKTPLPSAVKRTPLRLR